MEKAIIILYICITIISISGMILLYTKDNIYTEEIIEIKKIYDNNGRDFIGERIFYKRTYKNGKIKIIREENFF